MPKTQTLTSLSFGPLVLLVYHELDTVQTRETNDPQQRVGVVTLSNDVVAMFREMMKWKWK